MYDVHTGLVEFLPPGTDVPALEAAMASAKSS
jgi:hypothetical protein